MNSNGKSNEARMNPHLERVDATEFEVRESRVASQNTYHYIRREVGRVGASCKGTNFGAAGGVRWIVVHGASLGAAIFVQGSALALIAAS